MRHQFTFILLIVVYFLGLVACNTGAAIELDAATTATIAAGTIDAPATTAGPAPTTTPSTPTASVEATTAPTMMPAAIATATAAPTVLYPEVPRPALVLTTGPGFELHNPLTGERCPLSLPEGIGYLQTAGERLYFTLFDHAAGYTTVARVGPDGVVEPLDATLAEGAIHYNARFAVAADESQMAWTRMSAQDDPNATAFLGSLWVGNPDGGEPVTILEDAPGGELRILDPIRFSSDGTTLFFSWEPIGLGGMWASFNGRSDNLYRVPVTGGEPEKIFDCADMELFLCIGDFLDDGTVTYTDAERSIHVVGPGGVEMATIPTAGDYAGYPTFTPTDDLIYSEAVVPTEVDTPLPAPGTIYRVAAPYTGAPTVVATANGLLVSYMNRPFLDDDTLVVAYQEGEMWGSALLNMAGDITPLEPWPNAYLAAVWPE